MVRSYHTLACVFIGVILVLLVDRGLDWYALIVLGMTVPWDKLAAMTGELYQEMQAWRRSRIEQQKLEAVYE